MNEIFEFKNSNVKNFILNNILLIVLLVSLFCVILAYYSENIRVINVIRVFAILYFFILILFLYLTRSCQSFILDFNKSKISFKMYRKKSFATFGFTEINKIYLNNWLVFLVNGKKIYFVDKVSADLIACLNKIEVVKWTTFAKFSVDKKIKVQIDKAVIENKANV